MTSKTQKQMIREHLKRFGSITPLEALREYGCYRLGAIIYKLKADGMSIDSERVNERSRVTGRPVQFAKYKLKRTEQCQGQTSRNSMRP